MKFKNILPLAMLLSIVPASMAAVQLQGGSQVGGTEVGNPLGLTNPGTSATSLGATDIPIDFTAPGGTGSTTGTILGSDMNLLTDITFSGLVNSFHVRFTNQSTQSFRINEALAPGDMFTVTYDFNAPIGTFETGANSEGSTLRFATSFGSGADIPIYSDDTTFQLTANTVAAPNGQPLAPWDWVLASTNDAVATFSGALNEVVDFDFTGVSGISWDASLNDNAEGTIPAATWQYTDQLVWKITAGSSGIAANTEFYVTFDGISDGVPEPTGALLLGLGLASTLFIRRRR